MVIWMTEFGQNVAGPKWRDRPGQGSFVMDEQMGLVGWFPDEKAVPAKIDTRG